MHNTFATLQDRSEADLVRSAQQGSHDAFAELLRRSRPRVWRAANSILNNPEESEDALQNACWKAYEHLPSFRHDASFNTWFTSIVVNQSRMRLRQLRRARLVSIDDSTADRPTAFHRLTDSAPDPEESYADGELVSVLHREIRRLPAPLRQMMLLYIDNLSVGEAAERLGLTIAAAKTRLFRARQQLNNRMQRYAEYPAVAA